MKYADSPGKQIVDAPIHRREVGKSCRNGNLSQLIAKRRAESRYFLARRCSGQTDMKLVKIETRAVPKESLAVRLLGDLGTQERSPPGARILRAKTKGCVTERQLRFAEREDPLIRSSVVNSEDLEEASTELRRAAQVHKQQLSIHRGPEGKALEMSRRGWREVEIER